MPTSAEEGKDWLIPRIVQLQPETILDIGAGAGTYARMLRPYLSNVRITAVEIFPPYVETYGLRSLYDNVLIGDARTIPLCGADVVIMGDVIEHMPFDDAVIMWRRARLLAAKAVFVSLPIVEWPQGPSNGNEHEAHLHTWSHNDVMNLGGVSAFGIGEHIGTYRVNPHEEGSEW